MPVGASSISAASCSRATRLCFILQMANGALPFTFPRTKPNSSPIALPANFLRANRTFCKIKTGRPTERRPSLKPSKQRQPRDQDNPQPKSAGLRPPFAQDGRQLAFCFRAPSAHSPRRTPRRRRRNRSQTRKCLPPQDADVHIGGIDFDCGTPAPGLLGGDDSCSLNLRRAHRWHRLDPPVVYDPDVALHSTGFCVPCSTRASAPSLFVRKPILPVIDQSVDCERSLPNDPLRRRGQRTSTFRFASDNRRGR